VNRSKRAVFLLTLLTAGLLPVAAGARPSDDPYADQQWGLEEIQVFDAWDISRGKGVLVAVIDSGIDLRHPDLQANVVRKGKDFVDGGKAADEFGHGTHVAGIIAADTNNGRGIAGVAPSAKLMSVRVLDENNSGEGDAMVKGIRWAADNGADVINVSAGYPVPTYGQYYAALLDDFQRAIEHAWKRGAVVVMAAGNSSQPLCDQPYAPALCVGATGVLGEKTHYSNFDVTMAENYLVAPGGETVSTTCGDGILSTWLRSEPRNGPCDPEDGYAFAGGTSMATPMVSGVAALLASQGLSNEEIVERILATADDLGAPGKDPIYGAGRVNALKAVTGR